jgi:hypothetical protein
VALCDEEGLVCIVPQRGAYVAERPGDGTGARHAFIKASGQLGQASASLARGVGVGLFVPRM